MNLLDQHNLFIRQIYRMFQKSRLGLITTASSQITIEKEKQKMNSFTQYWCHNCSKITLPAHRLCCQFCHSEAIEEMTSDSHPGHYIPPQVHAQSQQHQDEEDPFIQLLSLIRPQRMMVRTVMPTVSFFRIIIGGGEEEERKTGVNPQKLAKLQKIGQLEQDCAICQESSGNGIRLGCKHQFHEHCIRPWFQQASSCPCCRATV